MERPVQKRQDQAYTEGAYEATINNRVPVVQENPALLMQYSEILDEHPSSYPLASVSSAKSQLAIARREKIYRLSCSPASTQACQSLQRPTSLDWEMWKSQLIVLYRRATARMIISWLESRGFYVTEKVLRDRFRKWRVNTKNRKRNMSKTHSFDTGSGGRHQNSESSASLTPRLDRPVSMRSEDLSELRLLRDIDDFLEISWSTEAGQYQGYRLVNLLNTLENATKLAADAQCALAWQRLKTAAIELRDADWLRISPRNIIYLIRIIGYWGFGNDTVRGIRSSVKEYVSTLLGASHPITSIMNGALSRKVDVETYLKIFTRANTKAQGKSLSKEDKESMGHYVRLSYVKILWYFRQYKRMEDVLNTWTPSDAIDRSYQLRRLAQAKIGLPEYAEAERLFKDALDIFTTVDQWIESTSGYVWSIVEQNRMEEAADVFVQMLSFYEAELAGTCDIADSALHVEWLRNEVTTLQMVTRCSRLAPLAAKLREESASIRILVDETRKSASMGRNGGPDGYPLR